MPTYKVRIAERSSGRGSWEHRARKPSRHLTVLIRRTRKWWLIHRNSKRGDRSKYPQLSLRGSKMPRSAPLPLAPRQPHLRRKHPSCLKFTENPALQAADLKGTRGLSPRAWRLEGEACWAPLSFLKDTGCFWPGTALPGHGRTWAWVRQPPRTCTHTCASPGARVRKEFSGTPRQKTQVRSRQDGSYRLD